MYQAWSRSTARGGASGRPPTCGSSAASGRRRPGQRPARRLQASSGPSGRPAGDGPPLNLLPPADGLALFAARHGLRRHRGHRPVSQTAIGKAALILTTDSAQARPASAASPARPRPGAAARRRAVGRVRRRADRRAVEARRQDRRRGGRRGGRGQEPAHHPSAARSAPPSAGRSAAAIGGRRLGRRHAGHHDRRGAHRPAGQAQRVRRGRQAGQRPGHRPEPVPGPDQGPRAGRARGGAGQRRPRPTCPRRSSDAASGYGNAFGKAAPGSSSSASTPRSSPAMSPGRAVQGDRHGHRRVVKNPGPSRRPPPHIFGASAAQPAARAAEGRGRDPGRSSSSRSGSGRS
jgi:hypothetical protein